MKFTEKTRDLIFQRANGRCEVCGAIVHEPQIHHRKPRGMGGTKNLDSRSPANGLLVHFKCHEWIERNRTEAYSLGYLVHQHEESATISVLLPDGRAMLHDDGTATKVDPAWGLEGKPAPRSSSPQDD